MKFLITGLLLVFTISCTYTEEFGLVSDGNENQEAINPMEKSDLHNLGAAPELNNDVWLNTDEPLRISDLEGNVILLEMWTFG